MWSRVWILCPHRAVCFHFSLLLRLWAAQSDDAAHSMFNYSPTSSRVIRLYWILILTLVGRGSMLSVWLRHRCPYHAARPERKSIRKRILVHETTEKPQNLASGSCRFVQTHSNQNWCKQKKKTKFIDCSVSCSHIVGVNCEKRLDCISLGWIMQWAESVSEVEHGWEPGECRGRCEAWRVPWISFAITRPAAQTRKQKKTFASYEN